LALTGMPAVLPGYDSPAFTLMPAAITCTPSVQTLDFEIMGPLIRCARLCGSCSSGQRFAMGFLPTSPRGAAVALRLGLPSARRPTDLHVLLMFTVQQVRPAGRTQKKHPATRAG